MKGTGARSAVGRTRALAVIHVCACVGGCATAAIGTASTTIDEITTSSKGAVVMMVSFEGISFDKCGSILVEASRAGGTTSIPRKVRSRGDPKAEFWIVEPGEYDVHMVNCMNGLSSLAGAGFTQQVASYGQFSVRPGEVVDVGHLVIGGEQEHRMLKVETMPEDTIQQLNRDFPKLSASMIKRPMIVDAAKVNAQEVAWREAVKREMSFGKIMSKAAEKVLLNQTPVPLPRK